MAQSENNKEKFTPSIEVTQEVLDKIQSGDSCLYQQVYNDYARFIGATARKYSYNPDDLEEKFAAGNIGFVKAIHTFKPEKGNKFLTWASVCIVNEIRMYIRSFNKRARLNLISLDSPRVNNDGEEYNLYELIDSEMDVEQLIIDKIFTNEELQGYVDKALATFNPKLQKVIVEFFSANSLTQYDIALKHNLTQSYVSRVFKIFKAKVHKELMKSGYTE